MLKASLIIKPHSQIFGQYALSTCCLHCWPSLNWFRQVKKHQILNFVHTSQDGIECTKTKKKCLRAYCPYIYRELSSLLQTAVDLTSLGTMHMEQWKGEAYQVGLKRITTILKLHAEHKMFYFNPRLPDWPKQRQISRTRTLFPARLILYKYRTVWASLVVGMLSN